MAGNESAMFIDALILFLTSLVGAILLGLGVVYGRVAFTGGKFPKVPRSNWLLGNIPFGMDVSKMQDLVDSWCENHGLAEYRIITQRGLLIMDEKEVAKLLKLRPAKVQRFHVLSKLLDYHSPGLFTAEQPVWGVERRIVSPAFSHSNLELYIPTMRIVGARLHKALRTDGADGRTAVDIFPFMRYYAADVTTLLSFGVDVDSVSQRSDAHVTAIALLDVVGRRLFSPIPYWTIPFIGHHLDGGAALKKRLHAQMSEIVAGAKAKYRAGVPGTSILDKFVAKSFETESFISDERLAGNAVTLLGGGSDTTAVTMTWMLYDLGRDPQLQRDARAEAAAAGISDTSTFAELMTKLPLLRSIFQEELRLRSPAATVALENPTHSVEIAGRICKPGEYSFMWPIRAMNRRAENFEAPLEFRARRWLTEDGLGVKPMPVLSNPFGGGPRICPGRDLALVEALVCVAELLLAFDIEMRDPKEIGSKFVFTVQPAEPVELHLTPREASM